MLPNDEALKVREVMLAVRHWPAAMRVTMATRIIMSVAGEEVAKRDEAFWKEEQKKYSDPLTDENVESMRLTHLMRKHGGM